MKNSSESPTMPQSHDSNPSKSSGFMRGAGTAAVFVLAGFGGAVLGVNESLGDLGEGLAASVSASSKAASNTTNKAGESSNAETQTTPSAASTSKPTMTSSPTESVWAAKYLTPGAQCVQKNLSPEKQLGQLLILGVSGKDSEPNSMAELGSLFNNYAIGGVVVMTSPDDIYKDNKTITEFIQKQNIPISLMVDQEGGTVQRIGYPSAGKRILSQEEVGKLSEVERGKYIKDVVQPMYEFLKQKGFDVILGPVADLGVEVGSPLPGRTFSTDPERVAVLAAQYVAAATAVDLGTSLKHFPGLGEAVRDDGVKGGNTDDASMSTPEWASIKDRSLQPYAALNNQTKYVMMGTQTVPGLTDGRPAALSQAAVELARGTLGDDVIIQTDDLNTNTTLAYQLKQGIKNGAVSQTVIEAFRAGVDQAMVVNPNSKDWSTQINGITQKGKEAMMADDVFAQSIAERVSNILAAKGVDPCSVS